MRIAILVAALSFGIFGCETIQPYLGEPEHPGPVPTVVRDVGGFLPPPWDAIAGGLAGILAGVGGAMARQKQKERKARRKK